MSVIDFFFRSLTVRPDSLPACNDDGGRPLGTLDAVQGDQQRRWEAAINPADRAAGEQPANSD